MGGGEEKVDGEGKGIGREKGGVDGEREGEGGINRAG